MVTALRHIHDKWIPVHCGCQWHGWLSGARLHVCALMCGHWYTDEHREWNGSFEISVWWFWQEKPSVRFSLFSGSYLIQTFLKIQGCQQEIQKKKGTRMSWWLKEWCTLWVPHCAKHVFVLCYFPFSCLPSLCAVIKSWGGLKQQTVGSFVAVYYSTRSILRKNWAWILGTSIFTAHMVHKLPV